MLRKSIVAGKTAHASKHVLSGEGEQGGEPHTTIGMRNNETAQTKSDENNEILPSPGAPFASARPALRRFDVPQTAVLRFLNHQGHCWG